MVVAPAGAVRPGPTTAIDPPFNKMSATEAVVEVTTVPPCGFG